VPSDSQRHTVLYDGFYTLTMRLVTMVGALAVGVLTARVLGPAGKGIYALPVVQAGLVSTLFSGLSSATTYFLLNGNAGRRIVAPSTIAAGIFVVVSSIAVIPIAFLAHAAWAAPAAIASLPAVAMTNVVTGYVVGIRRVRYATTITLITTLATFVITCVAFFLVARSPASAIVAWVVSTTLVAIVAWVGMLLHARKLADGAPPRLGAYLHLAVKVGATSLVSLLNYRADLYLVAVLLPPVELGLYSVSTSAAQSLLVPTQVAALVTSPHIGGLPIAAAANLATRCVRNNMLVALTVCAVLFVAAPWIVQIFYGAAFLPLVPSLRILLIGVVALSLGSPISSYYTLKLAKPEIPLVLAGVSAAICIAASLLLIPQIGILGAAWASTIAYIIGQGLGLGYFARKTQTPVASMLLPTREDVRIYFDFTKRLYRDCAQLLMLRFDATSK
jgi:O-antigen/teichoic acid export membrane protein